MKIIFKTPEGNVAVLNPSLEWNGSMEELGKKDIPAGLKFKIVEDSYIPEDKTFFDAWEIDESLLTDGVGEQTRG